MPYCNQVSVLRKDFPKGFAELERIALEHELIYVPFPDELEFPYGAGVQYALRELENGVPQDRFTLAATIKGWMRLAEHIKQQGG